jgi:hypothetical protein
MRSSKKLIAAILMAFLFSFVSSGTVMSAAPAEKPAPAAVKPAPPPAKAAPAPAKPAEAAEEETIAGTVVKTDKGIIIEAEDGDYIVKGQDLSKMVGKMIEATGKITESDKGDVIEVKSFEEIQE